MTKRLPDRVWSKISKTPDGCWLWTGARTGGYGKVYMQGHRSARQAHRLVYEALVGPVGDGLDLDHLCRVRHCVNPEHLEPVTRRINLLRGETIAASNAKKTHCPRGHEYTEANTRLSTRGASTMRACRTCHREREGQRRARRAVLSAAVLLFGASGCTAQELATYSFFVHLADKKVTPPPLSQVECVIFNESRGEQVISHTGDYGVFQINRRTWQPVFPDADLMDPLTNGAIAAHVYQEGERVWGNGWRPWVGARRCA